MILPIPKNLVAIVPVWGEAYAKICTDLLLPSLLAPGNLGTDRPDADITIAFCCPPETEAAIKVSPAGKLLDGLATLTYVDNTDLVATNGGKYQAMTESIHRVMNGPLVQPGETALMFLNPDVVCGAGLLHDIWRHLSNGKRAVFVPGLRTRLDSLPNAVAPFRDGDRLNISPSKLSRLALQHLHPVSQAYIWNEGQHPLHWPSMVCYRAGDGSLLMHCFHLHPIAIVCPSPLPQATGTVDGTFLSECGLAPETIHIAQDGESLVLVEVSGEPYSFTEPLAPPARSRVANFGVRHVDDIHWDIFERRISYAAGTAAPECTELNCIAAYVLHNRARRGIAKKWGKVDRHILRPLFALTGRLCTGFGR